MCEALRLRDVIFVGHSVSGVVGMLAVASRAASSSSGSSSSARRRCYVNDPPDYRGGFERADIEGLLDLMEQNYIGWANFLAPAVMKNPERPGLARELEESFCSTDPRIARRFAEATFLSDHRGDLARVRVPSLIMQCSEDAIAPAEVGDYLSRHLHGSTLRVLEGHGPLPAHEPPGGDRPGHQGVPRRRSALLNSRRAPDRSTWTNC